ncbi:MAG: hypothetical protein QOG99_3202, partial [Frankiales bacterium]|nr:hypothetical protein [Frankiales bacterium]
MDAHHVPLLDSTLRQLAESLDADA